MGSWSDTLRTRIVVRGSAKKLAAIVLRAVYPHPWFRPRNVVHSFGEFPWSGIVGEGEKILKKFVRNTPAEDEMVFADFSKMCDEEWAYNNQKHPLPLPLPLYSWAQPKVFTAEELGFVLPYEFGHWPETIKLGVDEVQEIFESNVLFALWYRCAAHANKGWLIEELDHFSITIDEYSLGGEELILTLTTIKCCLNNQLSLPYWTTENLWDEDLEVLTISDVHDHFRTDGDVLVTMNSWDTHWDYYYMEWLEEHIVDSLEDNAFFVRMCNEPYSFSSHDHDVFGYLVQMCWESAYGIEPSTRRCLTEGWTKMRTERNRLMHAVRIIQRWARTCLYDTRYKKGRKHAMGLWEELAGDTRMF